MTPAEALASAVGKSVVWRIPPMSDAEFGAAILADLAAAGFVVVPGVATADDRMRQAIEWARAMSEEPDDFPALLAATGEAMLAARPR